jgi:hypothetical protein
MSTSARTAAVPTTTTGAEIEEQQRPEGLVSNAGSTSLRTIVVRDAIAVWAGTRVAWLLFVYFASTFMHQFDTPTRPLALRDFVGPWNRNDAFYFYLPIATHGYANPIDANFFPLYPLLVRVVTFATGSTHVVVAGLIVSALASLAAIIGTALLAIERAGATRADAIRSVWLLMAYPLALFLVAPYAEALFLALVVFALLFARRRVWYAAALCSFFAALTRPTALALAFALIVEYGVSMRWSWRALVRSRRVATQATFVMLSAPAGLALYSLFCRIRYGDPLAYLHTQEVYFQHVAVPPWRGLALIAQNVAAAPMLSFTQARILLDVLPIVATLAILVVALCTRQMPLSFATYTAALLVYCVALPVVGTLFPDAVLSASRYLLVAIPVPLILARWSVRRPSLEYGLVLGGVLLQALFTSDYLINGFIV